MQCTINSVVMFSE